MSPHNPYSEALHPNSFGRSLDLDEVVKAGPTGRNEHPCEKGKTKLSPWEEERLCEN